MHNAQSVPGDGTAPAWRFQTRGGRKPKPRRDEWYCGKCGTSNFLENPTCRGCGGRAPDKAVAAATAAAKVRASPPGAIWSPGPKAPPDSASDAATSWTRGPAGAAAKKIADLEQALADRDRQLRAQQQPADAETSAADDAEKELLARIHVLEQHRPGPACQEPIILENWQRLEEQIKQLRGQIHTLWDPPRRRKRLQARQEDAIAKASKADARQEECQKALDEATAAHATAVAAAQARAKECESMRHELEEHDRQYPGSSAAAPARGVGKAGCTGQVHAPGESMLAALVETMGTNLNPEERQCFQAFQMLFRSRVPPVGCPAAAGTPEAYCGAADDDESMVDGILDGAQLTPEQCSQVAANIAKAWRLALPQARGHVPPGAEWACASLAEDAERARRARAPRSTEGEDDRDSERGSRSPRGGKSGDAS